MLWAVSGVSVLAVALDEHCHHSEDHDHHEALQAALHGHSHEGLPDHDHELTAPLSAAKTLSWVHPHAVASQAYELTARVTSVVEAVVPRPSIGHDHGPPSYLMHCAFLT